MLLHVRHEDVKVEGVNVFLESLRELFYPLVVFSVVLNERNTVRIITISKVGEIPRKTSKRACDENRGTLCRKEGDGNGGVGEN